MAANERHDLATTSTFGAALELVSDTPPGQRPDALLFADTQTVTLRMRNMSDLNGTTIDVPLDVEANKIILMSPKEVVFTGDAWGLYFR